jgi:hypothetical protein
MNLDIQRPLRVLHLERDDSVAAEVLNQLHGAGLTFGVRRVPTEGAYLQALRQYQPDVVVAGSAVDGSAVLEIAAEFSTTLPVVFFMEGSELGGVVQGAVALSRAEREREIAEVAARHQELRSKLPQEGKDRWAQRSAQQSLHGLAVSNRLRELGFGRVATG